MMKKFVLKPHNSQTCYKDRPLKVCSCFTLYITINQPVHIKFCFYIFWTYHILRYTFYVEELVSIDFTTVNAILNESNDEIPLCDEVTLTLPQADMKTQSRAKRQKKTPVVAVVENVKATRTVAKKVNSEPEIPSEVLKRLELHNNRMLDFANELSSVER
jgi:hypothetical protein